MRLLSALIWLCWLICQGQSQAEQDQHDVDEWEKKPVVAEPQLELELEDVRPNIQRWRIIKPTQLKPEELPDLLGVNRMLMAKDSETQICPAENPNDVSYEKPTTMTTTTPASCQNKGEGNEDDYDDYEDAASGDDDEDDDDYDDEYDDDNCGDEDALDEDTEMEFRDRISTMLRDLHKHAQELAEDLEALDSRFGQEQGICEQGADDEPDDAEDDENENDDINCGEPEPKPLPTCKPPKMPSGFGVVIARPDEDQKVPEQLGGGYAPLGYYKDADTNADININASRLTLHNDEDDAFLGEQQLKKFNQADGEIWQQHVERCKQLLDASMERASQLEAKHEQLPPLLELLSPSKASIKAMDKIRAAPVDRERINYLRGLNELQVARSRRGASPLPKAFNETICVPHSLQKSQDEVRRELEANMQSLIANRDLLEQRTARLLADIQHK